MSYSKCCAVPELPKKKYNAAKKADVYKNRGKKEGRKKAGSPMLLSLNGNPMAAVMVRSTAGVPVA